MKTLIQDLIPHAPALGLYVAPDVPADKAAAAVGDYASTVGSEEIIALFDGTLLGSAKDGAVFLNDRFVFQNSNFEQPQTIRYSDIVRVTTKKKLLGGKQVQLDVNRGRATVDVLIDFSGKPGAAEFVAKLLHEAMIQGVELGSSERRETQAPRSGAASRTNRTAVAEALDALCEMNDLTEADRLRMLAALDRK